MTLRAACRSLSRAPGFAALVVITLAIGIGATTAMFSVVDAVLLRPLRFAGANSAVEVWTRTTEGASAQPGIAGLAFPGLREGLADVAAIEGYQFGSGTIAGGTEPVIVSIPAVSPGLLHLIGASPILGRLFANEDAAPGSTSVFDQRPDVDIAIRARPGRLGAPNRNRWRTSHGDRRAVESRALP